MSPLDLVKLTPLLDRTRGRSEVRVGLIDGPVAMNHPEFASQQMREIGESGGGGCTQADSMACTHGTFVAGILSAKRGSPAPAICPDCTLLLRPIFSEATSGQEDLPSAKPKELAAAIIECIAEGAHCINLSLALAQPSSKNEHELELALNYATQRGVMIIAAAGNQGMLGSSAITRHPWVIPVVACNLQRRPLNESNLGNSIGKHGLSAPGDAITSLNTAGQFLILSGTSVAVPFVTGTIALLWSAFPAATAAQIKLAVTQASLPRRASVVPPLLDAEAAYQILLTMNARR